MGWFTSAGKLGIELASSAVYSGQLISGTVYADIAQDTDATSIQISLHGEENSQVHWTTTHTTGSGNDRRTRTVHHYAHATRTLVHLDVPLANFGGRIAAGRYAFPFTALVPPGMPTTMYARQGRGHCSISYELAARLHRPGIFKWDIKTKMAVVVSSAPLPPIPSPVFVQPDTQAVNLCCCISRGKMTVGATAQDSFVGRGEMVEVGIACKNNSRAEIKGISTIITEEVRWRAGGHSNYSHRVIGQCSFDPSSVAGTSKLSRDELRAIDDSASQATYQGLYQQLMSGAQRRTIACAPDARDTYAGGVITVVHRTAVRLSTPCCITDPEVILPIRIGTPRMQYNTPFIQAEPIAIAAPMVPMGTPVLQFPEGLPVVQGGGDFIRPADWGSAGGIPVAVAQPVELPMGQAVVGGVAVDGGVGEEEPQQDDDAQFAAPPQFLKPLPVTVDGLLEEMDWKSDDFSFLGKKILDPQWAHVFARLAPHEYGAIVGKVNIESDQPKVAQLLAPLIATGLTCAHVAAAVRSAADGSRAGIVLKVAPLCRDLSSGASLISSELSEWQQVVTRSVLPRSLTWDPPPKES